LREIRADLPEFDMHNSSVQHLSDGRLRWWTFAGGRANATLLELLCSGSRAARASDFYLDVQGPIDWQQTRRRMNDGDLASWGSCIAKSDLLNVKFVEALPEPAIRAMTIARAFDLATARMLVEQYRSDQSPESLGA
jgi:hypothetical protein